MINASTAVPAKVTKNIYPSKTLLVLLFGYVFEEINESFGAAIVLIRGDVIVATSDVTETAVTITPFVRTIFARSNAAAPPPPSVSAVPSSAFAVTIMSVEARDEDFNASEIETAEFAAPLVTSFIAAAAAAARFDTLPTVFAFAIAAAAITTSEPVAQTLALTATVVATMRVIAPDNIILTEVPSVLIVGITDIEILAPFDVTPVAIHVNAGPSVRVILPAIAPADKAAEFAHEFARALAIVLLTGVEPNGNDTVAFA